MMRTVALLAVVFSVAGGLAAEASAAAATAASPVEPAAPAVTAPSRTAGATIATFVTGVHARARAGGGRSVWFVGTATSWTQEPQSLLVLGSAEVGGAQWLRVLLPIRPDGSSGWVPRNDVLLSYTRYWLVVNTRARSVDVWLRGRPVEHFGAVIGKPATPTPDGLAAVYEVDPQPDPDGFLGPWALPLTALSNVLYSFGGGPGRIAIHGRGGASLIDPLGSAASHGCIRIDNGPVSWLAHRVPQGTPVQIVG